MSKIRNFLIVIDIKPCSWPVNILYNLRSLLEAPLGCPKCIYLCMAVSSNVVVYWEFNREIFKIINVMWIIAICWIKYQVWRILMMVCQPISRVIKFIILMFLNFMKRNCYFKCFYKIKKCMPDREVSCICIF